MEKLRSEKLRADFSFPSIAFFMLVLVGLEAKGLLAFQGRRGIASVARWNLPSVVSGVEVGPFPRCAVLWRVFVEALSDKGGFCISSG